MNMIEHVLWRFKTYMFAYCSTILSFCLFLSYSPILSHNHTHTVYAYNAYDSSVVSQCCLVPCMADNHFAAPHMAGFEHHSPPVYSPPALVRTFTAIECVPYFSALGHIKLGGV